MFFDKHLVCAPMLHREIVVGGGWTGGRGHGPAAYLPTYQWGFVFLLVLLHGIACVQERCWLAKVLRFCTNGFLMIKKERREVFTKNCLLL